METIASYIIKSKRELGHWDALIEEWMLIVQRFNRLTSDDVPYWYNERANVGLLAAAAWRCGKIALEEFQHDKFIISSDEVSDKSSNDKTKNGRCDLWISDGSKAEIIEAKFDWLNMLSDKMDEFSESCLESAVGDAIKARKARNDNTKAVGVAFLPVYARVDKIADTEALNEIIAKTINRATKSSAELVAWNFPECLRNYKEEKADYYNPGFIMLAKAVK